MNLEEKISIDGFYSPLSTYGQATPEFRLQEEGKVFELFQQVLDHGIQFDLEESMNRHFEFRYDEPPSENQDKFQEKQCLFEPDLGAFQEIKQGQIILASLDQKQDSFSSHEFVNEPNFPLQVYKIIQFFVQNSQIQIPEMLRYLNQHHPEYQQLELIKILINKFKKLKKTKEELIKYCMRKAFKFILEMPKNQALNNQISEETGGKKDDKNDKNPSSKNKNKFLRKASTEKSMNSKFLKQVFSEEGFAEDFNEFLDNFSQIIRQDNDKKIKSLAEMLTSQSSSMKKVELLRRLPWTDSILTKVKQVGKQLLKFAELSRLESDS